MTSKLSSAFFGNKKFLKQHYDDYMVNKDISEGTVKQIFQPYTAILSESMSTDNQTCLLSLFTEFIRCNLRRFQSWPFEKLSSWIELSAHVFEHSFEAHLSKKQSYEYFGKAVVRHSLFRPPHSVCMFSYEDSKAIMEYWIATFCRFYEEYRQCFEADLNQKIKTSVFGFIPTEATDMKAGKVIQRNAFADKFGTLIAVNQAPKIEKPPEQ